MSLPFSKRDLDGAGISIAIPDGKLLAEQLTKRLNDVEGTATIPLGAASVDVDVNPALHGHPLFWGLNTTDATLTSVAKGVWSNSVQGRFTLTGNANATAAVTVSYRVGNI